MKLSDLKINEYVLQEPDKKTGRDGAVIKKGLGMWIVTMTGCYVLNTRTFRFDLDPLDYQKDKKYIMTHGFPSPQAALLGWERYLETERARAL